MKKGKSILKSFLFLIIGIILVVGILTVLFRTRSNDDQETTEIKKVPLHIVAIGDSLTEGVGDSTNSGGYVSIVDELLEETQIYQEVTTSNYGKSGDRSDQILKRFYEDETMQKDIQTADMVVLTIGGNDIIQTFKKDFLTIDEQKFIAPEKTYEQNLKSLLTEMKKLNPQIEVYVFGIYNPYYVYFPEITEMQMIVDKWNEKTQSIVNETDNAVFLSISNLFNQSSESEGKENQLLNDQNSDATKVANPYLYEEDLFHPNRAGYRLMGEKLFQAIINN
ncbi:SGNH/GDSL hydrolase family protein [Carnobacterium viridans]|uniref:Lysophospholipase L1 n=1 Tax=Carnobacterium viridans TaxID=174587 RepID=A0A1H0XWJ4_9LACT|nr:SGNH/GDSL hydrolase family protein [Carnobacterium viridans]UDE95489.1 SGNH/GDSL hydrolase family protein [Carnobacterium viridans]SDQ07181.1 Lysophospholipase L1 [Carnobacterium viridans]